MNARVVLLGVLLLVFRSSAGADSASQARRTRLGIEGTHFTLNGTPTFLLGFSYYGALGASEDFIRRDLEDFQRLGFNWLRVWATWDGFKHSVSAFDLDGKPREPFFSKLRWLIAECDRRGLVVDVTLSRQNSSNPEANAGQLPNFDAHLRAVEALCTSFKAHRNWYLDLGNERDVRDRRYVSAEELKRLRARARELDPDRILWRPRSLLEGYP
jgi:FAD/FMN-containing dehydrogenase